MIINNVANVDLTLLLPGLLAEQALGQPEKHQAIRQVATEATSLPSATAGLESEVLNWFHGTAAPLANCAASLSYRLDYPDAAVQKNCLRVDPVFQQLDINEAILADRSVLDVKAHEAQAVIDDLNQHFADDGLTFRSVVPERWYCEFPDELSVQTIPPGVATGRSVSLNMVRGDHARVWRGWLSEIEMMLYSHPVNQQREAAGQPTISSLWLWGEGDPGASAPTMRSKANAVVYTSERYAASLADYLGVTYRSIADFTADSACSDVLIVDDRLTSAMATGDMNWYESILEELDASVFTGLVAACRRNRTLSMSIWGGDDRWLSTNAVTVNGGLWPAVLSGLRRFGRRKKGNR